MEYKICKVDSIEKLEDFNDEYVYDISMENDPHTFFANGILIHNSLYVNCENITKCLFKEVPSKWTNEHIEKMCKVVDKIADVLNENCKKIVKEDFNSDVQTIGFKRELFCTEAALLAKKNYALHIRDSEGSRVDKFEYKGIAIKKNEFTKKVKSLLKHIVDSSMIDKWDRSFYRDHMSNLWEQFKTFSPDDFAIMKQVGTDNIGESDVFMQATKGMQAHVKAATFYNDLIGQLKLKNKYSEAKQGDKVKVLYVKSNNQFGIEVIGWKDKFPKEFISLFEPDYEVMFEKVILAPLKNFIEIFNWGEIDVRNQATVDIMDL